MTLIEALRQAMEEELARDDRVFLVGEDVGDMVSDLTGPDDDHFHFGITIDVLNLNNAGQILSAPRATICV